MNRSLNIAVTSALFLLVASMASCGQVSVAGSDARNGGLDAPAGTPDTSDNDVRGGDGGGAGALGGAGGHAVPGTGGAVSNGTDARVDVTTGAGGAVTSGTDARVDVTTGAGGAVTGGADARVDVAASCRQAPIALGAASAYAVLAGSTVTSIGATSVIGNLGVSPGTAVTGFGPGTLVGTQHAGDPAAAQAQADLTTAFNDAAGRTLCVVSTAGNLGGQTLTPGLYKSTSSLEISSGELTLDAQGDASAVFIFQMASTLTTSSGRQVILSGGAKASNIFWQVGSSATLGSTSVFQGSILAAQAITLTTGASLNGRALARVAAVTLEGNTIVTPVP